MRPRVSALRPERQNQDLNLGPSDSKAHALPPHHAGPARRLGSGGAGVGHRGHGNNGKCHRGHSCRWGRREVAGTLQLTLTSVLSRSFSFSL